MIRLNDILYIGSSHDERYADLNNEEISAVLNVAQDLQGSRGWMEGIEYAQVGLIDGPGNILAAYYAAVLALATLIKRASLRSDKRVLICCHTGGRALAVVIMYLHTTNRRGWDNWLVSLHERANDDLPVLHEAHKVAFNKMNWGFLSEAVED